ncbi:MAG: hypothetical protein Q8M99_10930 [Methylotenera sp.]|nr:hypothetical protein [Methylotenera sp.]
MKVLLNKIYNLSFFVVITAITGSYATESQAKTLLYISPHDYNYSVRLLHPFYDYWFVQGPIVEPIALEVLKDQDSMIAMCTSNETADNIIRIKPSLFYNPQMRVYHSRLVATVYSGAGHVLGTYTGEAQQQGFTSVDSSIQLHLNKAYTSAMQDLMTKLKSVHFSEMAKAETKLPCGIIGAQTEPKISFY